MQKLSLEDIENIKKGDQKPLGKVFLAHYDYCTTALVKHDHCSLADAKDVVMDAIQVLNDKIVQGKFHNTNLQSYILTIARNKLRNKHKRDRKSLPFDPVKVENYLRQKEDSGSKLSESQQKKVDAVLLGLEKLGGKCKQIIRRNLYDGVPLKELTVELNYKDITVLKSTKSRCIKKLKVFIQELLVKVQD